MPDRLFYPFSSLVNVNWHSSVVRLSAACSVMSVCRYILCAIYADRLHLDTFVRYDKVLYWKMYDISHNRTRVHVRGLNGYRNTK